MISWALSHSLALVAISLPTFTLTVEMRRICILHRGRPCTQLSSCNLGPSHTLMGTDFQHDPDGMVWVNNYMMDHPIPQSSDLRLHLSPPTQAPLPLREDARTPPAGPHCNHLPEVCHFRSSWWGLAPRDQGFWRAACFLTVNSVPRMNRSESAPSRGSPNAETSLSSTTT